jgi:hypothetical protein
MNSESTSPPKDTPAQPAKYAAVVYFHGIGEQRQFVVRAPQVVRSAGS